MAPKTKPVHSSRKQYVKLDYAFLYSPERKALSLAAREVYTQLKAARNLKNGKGVTVNRSDEFIRFGFSDSNGISKPTFFRAIHELLDRGFIGVMEEGEMPNKKTAYALIDDWKQKGKGKKTRVQDLYRQNYSEERMWD